MGDFSAVAFFISIFCLSSLWWWWWLTTATLLCFFSDDDDRVFVVVVGFVVIDDDNLSASTWFSADFMAPLPIAAAASTLVPSIFFSLDSTIITISADILLVVDGDESITAPRIVGADSPLPLLIIVFKLSIVLLDTNKLSRVPPPQFTILLFSLLLSTCDDDGGRGGGGGGGGVAGGWFCSQRWWGDAIVFVVLCERVFDDDDVEFEYVREPKNI